MIAEEFVDPETGEILIENGEEIVEEVIEILERLGVKKIKVYKSDRADCARREPHDQEHDQEGSDRDRGRGALARSTPYSGPVMRPTSRPPGPRWSGCSSARSATTWAAWAAIRSISGSGSTVLAEPDGPHSRRISSPSSVT